MRVSQYLLSTLKETPNDAELASHQLMLRAGLIRRLSSGLYSWLPLGLKVLRKVEAIVRDEMDKAGALEVLMPAIQPAELWQESERWDTFGPLLLKMKDRAKREFCFGPTHEEVITSLMRDELSSYKQLPKTLYQIQSKFRDEIRPRFGVMRAREFTMKDAYSFHIDEQSMAHSYKIMYHAYSRIFDRLGLDYRAVEADSGSIGGQTSHEFQVLADSGEDLIFYSSESDYAANIEQATYLQPTTLTPNAPTAALESVNTPNAKTIEAVSELLNRPPEQSVKTLIVEGAEAPLVALILRGDHTLNELKAAKHPLIKSPLTMADEGEIFKAIGANIGSLGPVGLDMPVLVDYSAALMSDFICGANSDEKHHISVNWQRDASYTEACYLRNVVEGDLSPDGHGHLKVRRGIEVGHIFQLGTKYADSMKANVLDESGKAKALHMGCYGLGVSRVVAAAIEQHHDEQGICWPTALAPFQVVLIPMNMHKSDKVREACEQLYQYFSQKGIDVLFDDRKERPGVMFNDSELIGIPHRIVIGEKGLKDGSVEYKHRTEKDKHTVQLAELNGFLSARL